MQQRVSKGPKPTTPQERAQFAMEAKAEKQQRSDEEEGLCVPRGKLCAPRPIEGARRPHRYQEALFQKARREEMEM